MTAITSLKSSALQTQPVLASQSFGLCFLDSVLSSGLFFWSWTQHFIWGLTGIFRVYTLLTHSTPVCLWLCSLQNYCLSISYPYSVCSLTVYTNLKNLALFLVGLYSIFSSHFIDFSNFNLKLFSIYCLPYRYNLQTKFIVPLAIKMLGPGQTTMDKPLITTENSFRTSLLPILQQLHIHASLCLPEHTVKKPWQGQGIWHLLLFPIDKVCYSVREENRFDLTNHIGYCLLPCCTVGAYKTLPVAVLESLLWRMRKLHSIIYEYYMSHLFACYCDVCFIITRG